MRAWWEKTSQKKARQSRTGEDFSVSDSLYLFLTKKVVFFCTKESEKLDDWIFFTDVTGFFDYLQTTGSDPDSSSAK